MGSDLTISSIANKSAAHHNSWDQLAYFLKTFNQIGNRAAEPLNHESGPLPVVLKKSIAGEQIRSTMRRVIIKSHATVRMPLRKKNIDVFKPLILLRKDQINICITINELGFDTATSKFIAKTLLNAT